jgi:EmrB/QacA subfamily drug resistance transporter
VGPGRPKDPAGAVRSHHRSEAPRDSAATPDPRRWKALAVLGIAYLMVVLDVSIVNVALPSIQTDLGFSPSDLQWVVSGYALTFGGLLLLGGRAGDILGRRIIFMIGLALFAAFSLLCAVSQTDTMLIAARVLQGVGAAVLAPSVFSIVSVTFQEGAERNKALGILGAIAGSGAAIGVLAGGFLTEYAGWEWVFWVNVPIGLATLLVVPRFVRESKVEGLARKFDALGAVTVTGSLMLLVFGLTRANQVGWTSTETIGVLIASAVLMAVFLVTEARSRHALMPLAFFKRRTPTGANIVGLVLGTVVFGMFFLLSLYQQQVLGYSAVQTGVGYLAVALTAIVASGAAQALVTRIGVKPCLAFGMACTLGGLLWFTQISPDGTYFADLFGGFMLVGIGLGFSFVPVSIAALAGVPPREAGLASGLINTSQQIGGALGVAILTTVATTHTDSLVNEGNSQPTALTDGFALAFWVAAAFAAAGILATFLTLKREDLAETAEQTEGATAVG